jgi:putative acetyltransferase
MVRIVEPDYKNDMDIVRKLFVEYRDFLGVDLCFQDFCSELDGLPGIYAPPEGCILIAYFDNLPAGCVALKKIGVKTCEMKRLFVSPGYQGKKIGRKLAEAIIKKAGEKNYTSMKLDTLKSLEPALLLYKSLGFRETEPYVHNPLDDALFFELDLEGSA